jgi:hypothetical protein
MVLQVLVFKLRLKGWKKAKSEDLAPASALERTVLEPNGRDQAHASSACIAHVALAAIASPTGPWVFRAVTCAPTIKRT